MPLPDVDCESCSASCTDLYAVVGSVVSVAYEAVVKQLDPTLCEGFTGFVSHNEPNLPDADYVAGWIARIRPRDRNQSTNAGLLLPIPTVEIGVKLMETGFPMITGDGVPSYDSLTRAAMHSYSHAEGMARAIFANVGAGSQNKILRGCGWQGFSDLVPTARSGGMAGWIFGVSLTVPW